MDAYTKHRLVAFTMGILDWYSQSFLQRDVRTLFTTNDILKKVRKFKYVECQIFKKSVDVSDNGDFKLFSDASDAGYGGYIILRDQSSENISSHQREDTAKQKGGFTVVGSWSV